MTEPRNDYEREQDARVHVLWAESQARMEKRWGDPEYVAGRRAYYRSQMPDLTDPVVVAAARAEARAMVEGEQRRRYELRMRALRRHRSEAWIEWTDAVRDLWRSLWRRT